MYVRKTETLMSDIKHKIHRMERQALEAYPRTVSVSADNLTLYSAVLKAAEAAAWQEAPELKGKLPSSWLNPQNSLELRFRDSDSKEPSASLSVEGINGKAFHLPPSKAFRSYYRPTVDITSEHHNDTVKAFVAAELASKAKRAEIEDQFETVLNQVTAFMGQHASLNAAIKAMPEIELYVPDEYLSRMRAPTPPRAKKAAPEVVIEELNIDVNALTSAAIAHRIASAGS